MTPSVRIRFLHLLLGLSGAAGLGLQLTWTRRFTLGLGHELPAMLAVVTAFFLGLAVGSWTLAPRIGLARNPARWCAGLEVVSGVWALVTIPLVPVVNALALQWIGLEPSLTRHWAVTFGLPGLALLPATAAMGATLPAAERMATAWRGDQSAVASLYAVNTLGAVAGVVASVWWLMPAIGFRETTLAFGLMNLGSALGFAVVGRGENSPKNSRFEPMNRRDEFHESPFSATGPDGDSRSSSLQGPVCGERQSVAPQATAAKSGEAPSADGSGGERVSLIATLFVTGLAGIGFEVVGVRLLSQALENTVFTYAAALLVYLAGTAAGAACWHRWLSRRNPGRTWLLLGAAAACVAGTAALAHAPEWFERLRAAWGDAPAAVLGAEAAVAAAVFLPATFAGGMLFAELLEASRLAPGVGRALAVNTIGGALSPVVFGVGLFPWAGGQATTGIIAALFASLAVASLAGNRRRTDSVPSRRAAGRPLRRSAVGCWLTIGILAASFFTLVPARLDLQRLPPGTRLLSLREGAADTVAVLENPDGHRVLRVNNRFSMGGTASANAEQRHSHIPLLLHPAPRRALFLGVGTGISFAAMDAHPDLQADGVELVPEVAAAMPEFAPHNNSSPRLRVLVADARRFARVTTNRYDVIVADLFHPARDGAGALYTLEHFQALRTRLQPGGLICQWLPLFQLDEPTLRLITRTWLEVFPASQAFLLRANVDTPVLGLVGWLDNVRYGPGWLDRRVTDAGLRSRLRPVLLGDDLSLLGTWFADTGALRQLSAGGALNTDDHPRVLFAAPRWNFRRTVSSYALLDLLLHQPRGVPDGLVAGAMSPDESRFTQRLRDFTEARDRYLAGLMEDSQGHTAVAEKAFLDSAKTSADFTSGYAQILARATQQAQRNPAEARRLLGRLIEVRPERPVARELLDRLGRP